jgi:hypothetical protein
MRLNNVFERTTVQPRYAWLLAAQLGRYGAANAPEAL